MNTDVTVCLSYTFIALTKWPRQLTEGRFGALQLQRDKGSSLSRQEAPQQAGGQGAEVAAENPQPKLQMGSTSKGRGHTTDGVNLWKSQRLSPLTHLL